MRYIITALVSMLFMKSTYAYDYLLSATSVNLRESPTIKSSVIKRLSFGTKLKEVRKGKDGWINVRTKNFKQGWVLSKYVTTIDRDTREFYLRVVENRLKYRKNSPKDLREINEFVRRLPLPSRDSLQHSHNGRIHTHPFPTVGVRHTHKSVLGIGKAINSPPSTVTNIHNVPSGYNWIKDQKGCTHYNGKPISGESVKWTGNCKKGLGDGYGSLAWYNKGYLRYMYTGNMIKGKLHGDVVKTKVGSSYKEKLSFEHGEIAMFRRHSSLEKSSHTRSSASDEFTAGLIGYTLGSMFNSITGAVKSGAANRPNFHDTGWSIIEDNRSGTNSESIIIRCHKYNSRETIMYTPKSCSRRPYSVGILTTCDHSTLARAAKRVCH